MARRRVDWPTWGWSALAAFIAAFVLTFFTMLIHVPSRGVVTFYLFGPNGALFAVEWAVITVLIRRMLHALERHR